MKHIGKNTIFWGYFPIWSSIKKKIPVGYAVRCRRACAYRPQAPPTAGRSGLEPGLIGSYLEQLDRLQGPMGQILWHPSTHWTSWRRENGALWEKKGKEIPHPCLFCPLTSSLISAVITAFTSACDLFLLLFDVYLWQTNVNISCKISS